MPATDKRHSKECLQSILDADMINLAEEWVADEAFKVENEDEECYLTDEGEKVFVPIAQKISYKA